jgi:ribonuclease R
LVPIRAVGREYFHYDGETQTLTGSDTGQVIGIGQRVLVRLAEATPVTGGLTLDLLSIDGATLKTGRPKPGKYSPRKPVQSKAKGDGTKRRVIRKRK